MRWKLTMSHNVETVCITFPERKVDQSAGGYGYEAPFADDVDLDTYFEYVNGGSFPKRDRLGGFLLGDISGKQDTCFLDWEWLGVVQNWKNLEDIWMVSDQ